MSILNFKPEIWSAQLLVSLKKSLRFASPLVINRDYEGEIAQAGDTVRITSIGRPTVGDYVPGVTVITPEQLTDAQRSLVIDQSKFFAFEIDDIDARQAKSGGAMMNTAAVESSYALALVADKFVQDLLLADIATPNVAGAVKIDTGALALNILANGKETLDTCLIPAEGRYCIVPSWFASLLLLTEQAIWSDAFAGQGQELKTGVVGRKFGFDIVVAQYDAATGDDWYVYMGHPMACTFADQINKVEAYRPQNSFSDALKGLHLYGAKVVRPTALAMALCSRT